MTDKKQSQLLEWVEKETLKLGARETACRLSSSRGVEITLRDGDIESFRESVESQLALQIYYKGKYSTHQTNNLDRGRLEKFLKNAVDMTGYLSEDKARHLPDPSFYPSEEAADLDLVDGGVRDRDNSQKLGLLSDMYELSRMSGKDIISFSADYWDGSSMQMQKHSNGFFAVRESTLSGMGASVSMNDEGGRKPEGWKYVSARHFGDLPSREYIVKEALERTERKIGSRKIGSGKMKMLVGNDTVMRLLRPVVSAISGRNLFLDQSYLKGRVGTRVAADCLSITDDPFIARALGSRLYDGDGIAARKFPIIENGILKTCYIDPYYGEKLNESITTEGASNWLFKPGSHNLEELIAGMDEGILVDSFIGGNSNDTTGDFSYGIMGRYIRNGSILYPVAEMNISGNMDDLLMKILEVGNDPYLYSSYRSPSVLFDEVDFAGL